MRCRSDRAFTLVELLIVIVIMAVLIAFLLPALSSARKSAMSARLKFEEKAAEAQRASLAEKVSTTEPAKTVTRPQALINSFDAEVALTPKLSVGTAQPESIYEAKFSARLLASHPDEDTGEHVIEMPLPPQIVSLSDLEMKINDQPTQSVQVVGDKLVWQGNLAGDQAAKVDVTYSAVGRGLYALNTPPSKILDAFKIKLIAKGSDVRMLELSLQPTSFVRQTDQTTYVWDYKRLMFGRPIALDVLGIAPIDRLGELSWLGPTSVVCFGLLLGLIARAYRITRFDRWMLLMVIGTYTSAFPLMYFAQEFIPLNYAMIVGGGVVLAIIAARCVSIMGFKLGVFGVVMPAAAIMMLTLVAAVRPNLQGMLLTILGIGLFMIAMILAPRLKSVRELLKGAEAPASGAALPA
jgi:prepilin-type N-terminal cleavage/methylation domain-containing protein